MYICCVVLGGYDGEDYAPKLIPCSHTVCVSCLKVWPSGSVCRFISFFAEDRGRGLPTARVQAIPFCLVIMSPSCNDILCLQMPDMSRAHKTPTWWSRGFSAFFSREPTDRLDGSADQRGCTKLLSAWEPGESGHNKSTTTITITLSYKTSIWASKYGPY